jgi:hypothetical protein
MKSQPNEKEAERAVAALIETYRQGFLHLDPQQIASTWDTQHESLIYFPTPDRTSSCRLSSGTSQGR